MSKQNLQHLPIFAFGIHTNAKHHWALLCLLCCLVPCASLFAQKSKQPVLTDSGFHHPLKTDSIQYLVLNCANQAHRMLTFNNADGTLWRKFPSSELMRKSDQLDAFAKHPDYGLLVFECLQQKGNAYKVLLTNNPRSAKYLIDKAHCFQLQSMQQHILSLFSIDFDKRLNPLREAPSGMPLQLNTDPKQIDVFVPQKIEGDWLEVAFEANKVKRTGWIRWREKKVILIDYSYFD